MNYALEYISSSQREILIDYSRVCYLSDNEVFAMGGGNACILPGTFNGGGGVVLENGEYLENTYLHRGIGFKYAYDSCVIDDREVVYVGMFHDVWGHCFTDNLKHFWFLFDDRYKYLCNLTFVYTTVFPHFNAPDNFVKLLEMIGVDFSKMEKISQVTQFKRVYVPEDCFYKDCNKNVYYYTSEYKLLLDTIINRIECQHDYQLNDIPGIYDKVYFTRTSFNNPKENGEKRIERVFKKKGYTIVAPEKLSLEKMVAILRHCKCFVTTQGSISLNAVFMKAGANLVVIRKGNNIDGYQFSINELRDLNVTMIDAHKSVLIGKQAPWNGPFFMYVSRNLADYLQIRQPIFPVFAFLKYLYSNKYRKMMVDKIIYLKRLVKKCARRLFRF